MIASPILQSLKLIRKIVPPNLTNISPSPKYILFGEDDKDDEEFLEEIFSEVDPSFSLQFINNGRELIRSLNEKEDNHLPCLIVLDYNMPELNGAEILKGLKENKRYDTIPKVVWSTSGSDTYKNICLELGVAAYIIKPSHVKELKDIVRYMISIC
jgi:CheY-like chemotaxis protein